MISCVTALRSAFIFEILLYGVRRKAVVNAEILAIALPGREAHMGEKAISEDRQRPHLHQVSFLPSHS